MEITSFYLPTQQNLFDTRLRRYMAQWESGLELIINDRNPVQLYELKYENELIIEIESLPVYGKPDGDLLQIRMALLNSAHAPLCEDIIKWAHQEHGREFTQDDWIISAWQTDLILQQLYESSENPIARQGLSKPKTSMPEQVEDNKPKVGRPRSSDNTWAYQQVRELGRPPADVYPEWFERVKDLRLADPRDSFNKAIRPKKEKKEKTD
jgi:hypothetical protein